MEYPYETLLQDLKIHIRRSRHEAVAAFNKAIQGTYQSDNYILEKNVEKSLVQNITKFLLSLGKGFSFVGQQYHISVGGQDFYIDLLFYHLKLRCFIVLELKVGEFKPEYVGKLNFYISAADELIRREEDQPTIGLLLCKSKNDWVVEYALRDFQKPMGVAVYKLPNEVTDDLKKSLPTEKDWERLLSNQG